MKEVAKEHELEVTEVMSESGSGFKIGRPIFHAMIEKIERGEADGIIVWKLSRLSRNPDDAGKIMGLLQRGEIKHIRTVERNWYPEDNVMMMYVEFGITNQYSRDLSVDVKRGLIKKAERGWYPSAVLPLGYLHSPYKKLGDDEIIVDETRFDLIQEGLKSVASKKRTPMEAWMHLVSIGVTGVRGKPLSHSVWYWMLSQPLYAGSFEYPARSGMEYQAMSRKAIEPEEFEAIQVILGKKDKPRPKTHYFPYTGLMKCGECGCSITAEEKHKHQKNGNTHDYMYYHCTKKKGACSQSCTSVAKLEKQYAAILTKIKVPQAFHEWALEEIQVDQQKEIHDRDQSLDKVRHNYDECLKKIDDLAEGYVAKKVPEDTYDRKLAEYNKTKKTLKKIIDGIDERVDERLQELDDDLDFAVTAKRRYDRGDDCKKREIVFRLGSNLILKDHVLEIQLKKPLEMMEEIAKEVNVAVKRFEPLEKADNKAQFKAFLSQNPDMRRGRDSNPRSFRMVVFKTTALGHYATSPYDVLKAGDH